MAKAHEALVAWWQATAQPVAISGALEADVQRLEMRYGVALPTDLRDYLLHAAPSQEFWDDGDAIWWPLDRIKNIPDEYEHDISDQEIAAEADTYLFFADYMIWCWAWAICCSEGENRGKVAVIGTLPDHFVADSFSEFVERYINDPLSVC